MKNQRAASPGANADRNAKRNVIVDRTVPVESNSGSSWSNAEPYARRVVTVAGQSWAFIYCPPTGPDGVLMGSPEDEADRLENERLHAVILTKGFWLMETPVTQRQWKAVVGSNPSYFKFPFLGRNLPVERVSWNDCVGLVKILNKEGYAPSGWQYGLPTEAQWEYACRAGSTEAFCDPAVQDFGWFRDNSHGRPHRVARKRPNAWGFYDMHGNVWEWCFDVFGAYPAWTISDPQGAADGIYRVYRGGSWYGSARRCRSASRNFYLPEFRNYNIGCRLALTPVR